MTSQSPSPDLQQSPLYKSLVVIFLLAIAVVSALSSYRSGNWFLNKVPELSHLQELRTLQKSGLTLPEWETFDQKMIEIGGHKWSIQAIAPQTASLPTASLPTASPQTVSPQTISPSKPVSPSKTISPSNLPILLMLRPQTWHRDLPQMDWMDIRGARNWTEEDDRHIQFSVPAVPTASTSEPTQIDARFLRGWTQEKTYAVLQWYAWRNGGNPAPSRWFWAEQGSQLRDRQHMPWVAVSLLIPIQPLSEIESVQSQAESLGQLVQSRLTAEVFR